MKVKEILICAVILATGGGGFAALKASRPEPEPVQVEERSWLVSVRSVTPSAVAPGLLLYSRVESPTRSTLRAAIAADVVAVPVREGQNVAKDQTLIRLDRREVELLVTQRNSELREIEAQLVNEVARYENDLAVLDHETALLELTGRDVNRYQDLAKRNLDSASRLESAQLALERQKMALAERRLAIRSHDGRRNALEAQLEKAKALHQRAVLDTARTELRAAFDARVVSTTVAPGDRVRAGDPMLELYERDGLELRAQVPTRFVATVRAALAKQLPLRGLVSVDNAQVSLRLVRMSAEVSRGSGGADAFFEIPPDLSVQLELGSTLAIQLELPAIDNAVRLPSEALYGADTIYKLDGERLKAITIERHGEWRSPNGTRLLVVSSPEIEPDDQIVSTQLPNAMSGLKVRVARPQS